MGQNNLDHYIKSTLSNHQTMINTDEVWSGIQVKKKNKAYRVIAVSSLILLSIVSIFFIKEHTIEHTTVEQRSKADVQDVSSNIITTSASNTSIDNRSTLIDDQSDLKGAAIQSDLKIETDYSDSEIIETKTSDLIESESNSVNSPDIKKTIETKNNKSIVTNKLDIAADSPMFSEEKTNEGYLNNLQFGNSKSTSNQFIKGKNKLDNINTLPTFLKEMDVKYDALLMRIASTDCPTFGTKKNKIFAEVYSTLDYVNRSYDTALESQEYLTERTSSQSYRPSYRVGAQIKYLFKNGLFVKGGIEYGVAREKFTFRKETITTEIRPGQVINIHVDMNGDTTRTLGNGEVTIIETKNWKVKNSYKSLGIPLTVGYQIQKGPWFYALEAGAIYNLSFSFKGMLLDQTMTPIDASDYFKNTIGVNYTFGFTVGYNIQPQLSFLIKGNARSITNNINSDINIINEKYTMIGSGIGLEYQF